MCHATLLKLINDSTLPGALVRWLATYLHGRQARTLFRDTVSSSRIVRFGVPQGSVVAPTLSNFYVADAPMPPPTIFLVSYADDFTVFALGTDIETLSKDINSYLTTLCNFLDSRDLEVSTPKCSVTLFTAQHQRTQNHTRREDQRESPHSSENTKNTRRHLRYSPDIRPTLQTSRS